MKKALALLLCLGLFGCASMDAIRTTNRENLNKLSIGMTKSEVLSLMGTETIKTMVQTITNPYKTEILQGKNGKTLEVLYYYTEIKRTDDIITDDSLTPLVFDNGKLIGWGWSFLQDNVHKYELRMR